MRSTEVTVNKMMVVIINICMFYYVLKVRILEKRKLYYARRVDQFMAKALQVDYKPVANIKAIKPNKKAIKIYKQRLKKHQNTR